MKIGINCERLLIPNPAGPEKYTYNLINALARTDLAKADETNQYTLYFNGPVTSEFFARLTEKNPRFTFKTLKKHYSWTQVSLCLELFRNPVDVFFTSVHTMPILMPMGTKKIGMIHGLEYTFSREYLSAKKTLGGLLSGWLVSKPEWFVCAFSDVLIVPSQHSKTSILNMHWPLVNPAKIHIVYEGVSPLFTKSDIMDISPAKKKYGLQNKDYLIFVSTVQPRKNIPLLIEGYAKFIKSHPDFSELNLVIVGKKGWLYEDSINAPKKFGVEDKVRFLGHINDDALVVSLLSGAKAFVSASLDEGFGLHLLEAMACETPCAVSDISAYREVAKDSVIYFDPKNPDDISRGIADALDLNSKVDLRRLVYEAKLRSRDFTWEYTAERVASFF